jgi:uncharacterized protein YdaU (DUF1376 family)
MHYYQHNIADYRKDTSHLSLLEHGVYHQLIDQYYLSEQPIPLEETKLYRLMSARSEDEKIAIQSVLEDFFVKTEDGYIHKRCDIEIEAYQTKSERAVVAAKLRWGKESDATAMRTHIERIPTAMQTINHKPITNKPKTKLLESDEFLKFWNAYPKKVGKDKALESWNKTRPNIEEVLIALDWQVKSDQWFKNGGQFIPNPTTYLNQGRWKDEPPIPITF